MANWTQHTKYTFHAENLKRWSADELAFHIESHTGLCVMVSEYYGAWRETVTQGFKVEYIASCNDTDGAFHSLNKKIKALTGNNCLMPVRETIEVFCECDADHTD